MEKKRIIYIVVLLAGLLLLAGCFGADAPDRGKKTAPTAPPSPSASADGDDAAKPEPTGTAPTETEPTETEPTETEPTETEPTETEPTETEPPEDDPGTADPIAARIAGMTLEERAAQLFVVSPEALLRVNGPLTGVGENTRKAFESYPVGGVILFGKNLTDAEQTIAYCRDLQALSRGRLGLPLFICVDEEGGSVARIANNGNFNVPKFEYMSEVTDEARAEEIGSAIGSYLAALGFNVDFAPDADVLSNPENTVVKRRSFGADPAAVTRLAAAYAKGMLSFGVLPTYKHFPGHGATAEDSHLGYAVSHRTMQELLSSDLMPFRDAAENSIPFVMAGHISTPQATDDGLPASLSYAMVTGVLREKLGYNGVVITDELSMGAVSKHYAPGEAAVMAIKAGDDMLLLSESFLPSYNAVLEAVKSGEISEERLNASVYRILNLKLNALRPVN